MESQAFKERDAASYDGHARAYGAFIDRLALPLAEHLCERADLRAGDRVLDVGCGTGVATRAAAARVEQAGRVTGIDLSHGMIAEATRMGGAPEYVVMDAEALDFESGSFDAVVSLCAVIHLPDIRRAVHEMERVLRPGGRLAVGLGYGKPMTVAGLVRRARARSRPWRRRLVAPAAIRDLVLREVPRPPDDLTAWASLADPLPRLRRELRDAGFTHIRRSWCGHEVRFASAEDVWEAQVAIVTEARKRLQSVSADVAARLRAELIARAEGAELVYPYQAAFLDARKPSHAAS